MIYSSTAFGEDACFDDLRECPLAKYKIENGVKTGYAPITENSKPSERDVAFVKKFYPWRD